MKANGVFERGGKWWMRPRAVVIEGYVVKAVKRSGLNASLMPDCEIGPFPSEDVADAGASYVFATWLADCRIPDVAEIIQVVTAPPPVRPEGA